MLYFGCLSKENQYYLEKKVDTTKKRCNNVQEREGRRLSTEVNLMNSVVKAVATLGFENASIKSIAQQAGTAVSTIYCHFNSKEDLFEETFMHMAEEFCSFYASDISHLRGEDRVSSIRSLWYHYLNFFLSRPDEALFYIRYRHSAYYTDRIRYKVLDYEAGYLTVSDQIARIIGLNQKDENAGDILRFFVEMILIYAEQIIMKEATREYDELAFQATCGAVFALEDAFEKSGR
jgi:AcrR family transcriptional regulator